MKKDYRILIFTILSSETLISLYNVRSELNVVMDYKLVQLCIGFVQHAAIRSLAAEWDTPKEEEAWACLQNHENCGNVC